MQTLKTAVVVVLLISVCYGAFIALNAPDDDIPESIQQWANSDELEALGEVHLPDTFEIDAGGTTPLDLQPWSNSVSSLALPTAVEPTSPAAAANNSPGDGQGLEPLSLPGLPALPGDNAAASTTVTPATNSLDLPVAGVAAATDLAPPTDAAEAPVGTLVSRQTPTDAASLSAGGALTLPIPGDIAMSDASAVPASPPLLLPTEPAAAPGDANPASGNSAAALPELPFEIAREQALAKAGAGDLEQALTMLSPYYESPELGHAEHSDLVNILDALSREVIYSKRHLMEAPYSVAATDTLASVAAAHRITPELLASMNDLGGSKALLAGAQLKVIQGPFRARISLTRGEMTIFLGELYAGRFPFSVGKENPPSEGVFEVVDRRLDRTYYGTAGVVIKAHEPENPYGGYWLSLGNNLSIHGSPEMERSDLANAGCISLAQLDASHAYIILDKNSQVEIRR